MEDSLIETSYSSFQQLIHGKNNNLLETKDSLIAEINGLISAKEDIEAQLEEEYLTKKEYEQPLDIEWLYRAKSALKFKKQYIREGQRRLSILSRIIKEKNIYENQQYKDKFKEAIRSLLGEKMFAEVIKTAENMI